jgi:hypothetical protein
LPGVDEETDSELRIRREQALAIAGASTVDAIRADVLSVTGVDSCTVFENPTSVTDALGLPPKSIEVLVNSETGPAYDAQGIRDEILLRKSAGNTYTVKYSEPDTVTIHVELTVTTNSDYGADGDDNVAETIATWATNSLRVGDSVFASDIINAAMDVTGVVSVTVSTVMVDDDDPPVTVDHVLTARQLGVIDSANVDVTS